MIDGVLCGAAMHACNGNDDRFVTRDEKLCRFEGKRKKIELERGSGAGEGNRGQHLTVISTLRPFWVARCRHGEQQSHLSRLTSASFPSIEKKDQIDLEVGSEKEKFGEKKYSDRVEFD